MTWPSTLPTILPLLILTPSKTSPFIRISFNFSLSFLSSSACFLVRSGEIKMSLKFSEFESFRAPKTTLHLTATYSLNWYGSQGLRKISDSLLLLYAQRLIPFEHLCTNQNSVHLQFSYLKSIITCLFYLFILFVYKKSCSGLLADFQTGFSALPFGR